MKYIFMFVNRNAEDGIFFLFIFLKQMAKDEKKTKKYQQYYLFWIMYHYYYVLSLRLGSR